MQDTYILGKYSFKYDTFMISQYICTEVMIHIDTMLAKISFNEKRNAFYLDDSYSSLLYNVESKFSSADPSW